MKLRRLAREDLPLRVEWMNNSAIYASMHFSLPVTLDTTNEWFERNLGNCNRVDLVLIEDGEIVAFAGVTNINQETRKGESYTFVHPEKHGKGIGLRARSMVLDYAFGELGLNKVYAYTNEDNLASCKLSEKLGFILEGRLRQEYLDKDGVLKDRLYYGLLKEEWEANR